MGRRRQAREIAFKLIFQIDVGRLAAAEVLAHARADRSSADEAWEYAERLVKGVVQEKKRIDGLIAGKTLNWEMERLESVDRNLLRLATYELLRCPEVPKNVVIDEAIELAKKYSTEESGKFVNGVLDQVAAQLEGGE